jgi:hypothetical protein
MGGSFGEMDDPRGAGSFVVSTSPTLDPVRVRRIFLFPRSCFGALAGPACQEVGRPDEDLPIAFL